MGVMNEIAFLFLRQRRGINSASSCMVLIGGGLLGGTRDELCSETWLSRATGVSEAAFRGKAVTRRTRGAQKTRSFMVQAVMRYRSLPPCRAIQPCPIYSQAIVQAHLQVTVVAVASPHELSSSS